MRFGVLIDSTCDAPPGMLADPRVRVLPIHAFIGDQSYTEDRSAEVRKSFVSIGDAAAWKIEVDTAPFSREETAAFVLDHLATQFDYVFAVVATRARSAIYQNLMDVALTLQPQITKRRADAGCRGPFRLQVADMSAMFAGHAVIAQAVLDALDRNELTTTISRKLEQEWVKNACGYFVPSGLRQLFDKARKRGDKSVSFVSFALGSALDIKPIVRGRNGTTGPVAKVRHFEKAVADMLRVCTRQVESGLIVPHVVMSYDCHPTIFEKTPEYAALADACEARQVKLQHAPMGIAALVNAGTGAFSIGFIAPEHEFN
jgi:fatty acid-binding protein DegV